MKTALKLLSAAALSFGFIQSADAAVIKFVTDMNQASEPTKPVPSPATGQVVLFYDDVAHSLNMHVTFSGLVADITGVHIHCCTANPLTGTVGVATMPPVFPGFPMGPGITSGVYDQLFTNLNTDTSFYNPSFVTAHGGTAAQAEIDFFAGMMQGRTYLQIHTTSNPGGEIRGFLLVPEPGAITLFGIGLLGLAYKFRRRQAVTKT